MYIQEFIVCIKLPSATWSFESQNISYPPKDSELTKQIEICSDLVSLYCIFHLGCLSLLWSLIPTDTMQYSTLSVWNTCVFSHSMRCNFKNRTVVNKIPHVKRKKKPSIKYTRKGHFYISNRFIAIFTELTVERKLPSLVCFVTFTLATNTRKIEMVNFIIHIII